MKEKVIINLNKQTKSLLKNFSDIVFDDCDVPSEFFISWIFTKRKDGNYEMCLIEDSSDAMIELIEIRLKDRLEKINNYKLK